MLKFKNTSTTHTGFIDCYSPSGSVRFTLEPGEVKELRDDARIEKKSDCIVLMEPD